MADLALAEGAALRAILDATHNIWGEGLTPGAYERYYMAQLGTAWARQHLRRFALLAGTEVAASAKEYTSGHRMYGLVESDLLWAFDMAAMGQPLQPHLSASLKRIE